MKIKTILMSMLAVAALASCNKEEVGGGSPIDSNYTGAYLSVGISMPKSDGTRAAGDPGTDSGTAEEQAVKSVYVIGFKDDANLSKVGVYSLTDITTAANAFSVSPDMKKMFVVINPSAKTLAVMNSATTYAAMNLAITEAASELTLPAKGFMMTSAGVAAGDKGLSTVTPSIAASESPADIAAAKNAAEAAKIPVSVDRAVAKVALKPFVGVVENGTADVTGWQMNATTKEYYPYAELIDYEKTDAKYRVDPTWDDQPATRFGWLNENSTISWITPAASNNPAAYCLENTMSVAAQNYNNTTKATIKARFAPVGVTLGSSWYRVGGVVKTLADLKVDYKAAEDILATTPGDTGAAKLKAAYDAFKGELGMTAIAFKDLVEADMDNVANGGYKAATAADCMIEYFQKSVCYYNVNLNHDNRVVGFGLGRWGVVRNNSYTLTVDKISQAGSPYIPNPTDPDITDPSNPDPNNPGDNDTQSAFIAVTITMNAWTTWDQNIEL